MTLTNDCNCNIHAYKNVKIKLDFTIIINLSNLSSEQLAGIDVSRGVSMEAIEIVSEAILVVTL